MCTLRGPFLPLPLPLSALVSFELCARGAMDEARSYVVMHLQACIGV